MLAISKADTLNKEWNRKVYFIAFYKFSVTENSLESLLNHGVDHIELRMFDLNPIEKLGISRKDLAFAHLFLIFLLNQEDFDFTPEMQANAIQHHQSAALYDLSEVMIDNKPIKNAANDILNQMEKFFSSDLKAKTMITYQRNKLTHSRICEIIKERSEVNV